ncbi:hypothetical protein B7R87_11945 [Streptomyces tsukubensis]|nr:hypothetical protein B7R87_11945 [Streptomyces tsukubensis]
MQGGLGARGTARTATHGPRPRSSAPGWAIGVAPAGPPRPGRGPGAGPGGSPGTPTGETRGPTGAPAPRGTGPVGCVDAHPPRAPPRPAARRPREATST